MSGASSAVSGVFARLHAGAWSHRCWGHFDELGITADGVAASCSGFCVGCWMVFSSPALWSWRMMVTCLVLSKG